MRLERCEYGCVVSQRVEKVVFWPLSLSDSFVGSGVECGHERVEECRLDVGFWIEVSPVDVVKCTFDDFVGYGKALFGRCEAALSFVTIVEIVDYQSK